MTPLITALVKHFIGGIRRGGGGGGGKRDSAREYALARLLDGKGVPELPERPRYTPIITPKQ